MNHHHGTIQNSPGDESTVAASSSTVNPIETNAPGTKSLEQRNQTLPTSNDKNNHQRNSNHRNKRSRSRAKRQKISPPLPPQICSVCEIANDQGPPKYKCPKCRATYCSVACCRQHKTVCPGKPNSTNIVSATTTAIVVDPISTSNAPTPTTTTATNDSDSDYDDDSSLEDGWEITDDMKVALRNSIWLRGELQDGGLREMIASVVQSRKTFLKHKQQQRNRRHHKNNRCNNPRKNHPPHPHEVLAEQKDNNRNFKVFMDKLLVLADVLERQDPLDMEAGVASGGHLGNHRPRNEEELEEWLSRPWEVGSQEPALALKPRIRKAMPKFKPIDASSDEDNSIDGNESVHS